MTTISNNSGSILPALSDAGRPLLYTGAATEFDARLTGDSLTTQGLQPQPMYLAQSASGSGANQPSENPQAAGNTPKPPPLSPIERKEAEFFRGVDQPHELRTSFSAEINWTLYPLLSRIKTQQDLADAGVRLQALNSILDANFPINDYVKLYAEATGAQQRAMELYNQNFLPAFKQQMVVAEEAESLIQPGALLTPTSNDTEFDNQLRILTAFSTLCIKKGMIKSGIDYIGFHAEAYHNYKQGNRDASMLPNKWAPFGYIVAYDGQDLRNIPNEYFGRLKPVSAPSYFFIDPGSEKNEYPHATPAEASALIDSYQKDGRYPLMLKVYDKTFNFGFIDIRQGVAQVVQGIDLGILSKVRLGLDRAFSDVINTNLPLEQRVKAAITFRLLANLTHAYYRGNVPISTHAGVGLLAMLGVPSGPEAPHFEVRALMHGSRGDTNLNRFVEQETQAAMERYYALQGNTPEIASRNTTKSVESDSNAELPQVTEVESQDSLTSQPETPQPAPQTEQSPDNSLSPRDRALVGILQNTQYVESGRLTDAGRDAVQQKQKRLKQAHIRLSAEDVAYGLLGEAGTGETEQAAKQRYQDAVRQAVFKDLDQYTGKDGFRSMDPLDRYRAIYERYQLGENKLTVWDAITGHVELIEGKAPGSVDELVQTLPANTVLQRAELMMTHFFHESHLLEGNPDDSTDVRDMRSLITVNMRPDHIDDLGDVNQAANYYVFGVFESILNKLGNSGALQVKRFLNGGELPSSEMMDLWRDSGHIQLLGIYHTDKDIQQMNEFGKAYSFALHAAGTEDPMHANLAFQFTNGARDLLKRIIARNHPDTNAAELQRQYLVGEAIRRANGAAEQHPIAAQVLLQGMTYDNIVKVARDLWAWSKATEMPAPDEVERIYNQLIESGEYPVSAFTAAAEGANLGFAYIRGDIGPEQFINPLVEKYIPKLRADINSAGVISTEFLGKVIISGLEAKMQESRSQGVSLAASGQQDTATNSDADANGATDSLSDQVSNESSNALADQYRGFAEESGLFNLNDQQKHAGYTNFSLHKRVESGPGTIGIVPYNLPGLLSESDNLISPVETGIDQSTQTEYIPAQIAPATISTGNTTPAESSPEQARLEQTVRNAYMQLLAEVQAILTLEEFRQLDFTEINLAQQYKDYTSLHRNVTHQDNKSPMRLADYIKFGPEIQQRLQQWSDQAKRSDVTVSTYQKQTQIYRDQAESLQQVTQQIQQATAELKAAQSAKPAQSNEWVSLPSRYPAAGIILEQINKAGNASNNIMNTTKAGAPIGGKANTNVPMISLKNKTGLGEYTQSSTIPKYLYKPNQQSHQLQLHVVVESGNQLSLQAVPLSVYKPQSNIGTHYKPQNGWQNIPQLNAAQQSQINQYLQQSTFIMPSPVMAPTAPAGSGVSAPVPVPVP